MKKLLLPLLAVAAFLALGAADPVPVSSIHFVGTNPTFNGDGTLATAPMQAMYNTDITVTGVIYHTQTSVTWDGTSAAYTVTADGITATPKQISDLLVAAANYAKTH